MVISNVPCLFLLVVSVVGQVCELQIAETVPVGVNIEPVGISIYNGWMEVISKAQNTLDIVCMYFTLTQGSQYNDTHAYMGRDVFNAVIAATKRGVAVRVVTTSLFEDDQDVKSWEKFGVSVRYINWTNLVGSGILHAKFMIADSRASFVGSANFDWRALTHTKEIGVFLMDCPSLSQDVQKIFELNWLLAVDSKLPPAFPKNLDTVYNMDHPADLPCEQPATVYYAASPNFANTPNRTNDIDAMLSAINSAERTISASVMDYSVVELYSNTPKYWPILDDAFRSAAARGVKLRLLFSLWENTPNISMQYIRSLAVLDNIEARLIVIPPNPGPPIPFTRVSHSKYLVTEKTVYLTTSNWTPDYFLYSSGVSVNCNCSITVSAVQLLFNRDWLSPYSSPVTIQK